MPVDLQAEELSVEKRILVETVSAHAVLQVLHEEGLPAVGAAGDELLASGDAAAAGTAEFPAFRIRSGAGVPYADHIRVRRIVALHGIFLCAAMEIGLFSFEILGDQDPLHLAVRELFAAEGRLLLKSHTRPARAHSQSQFLQTAPVKEQLVTVHLRDVGAEVLIGIELLILLAETVDQRARSVNSGTRRCEPVPVGKQKTAEPEQPVLHKTDRVRPQMVFDPIADPIISHYDGNDG